MNYEPYTTIEDVQNYLGVTIDPSLMIQMDIWIKAMTLQIDAITNRDIYKTGADTYVYDGDGTNLTLIKDCHSITEVRVNDVAVEVAEYPKNKPYTSRILLDGEKFPVGINNIEVDAVQSMALELPEDVRFACTVMVAGIYTARNTAGKEGITEKIGSYSISFAEKSQHMDYKDAVASLSGYKRLAL